jgi:hypothetical protein
LADVLGGRWPRLAGFSWWNERWENDDNRQHDSDMRLQDIPELAKAFDEEMAAHAAKVQQTPVFTPAMSGPQ